eukprot:SAG11_NODE_383_length_9899_cov_10.535510_1_plen_942_part_00
MVSGRDGERHQISKIHLSPGDAGLDPSTFVHSNTRSCPSSSSIQGGESRDDAPNQRGLPRTQHCRDSFRRTTPSGARSKALSTAGQDDFLAGSTFQEPSRPPALYIDPISGREVREEIGQRSTGSGFEERHFESIREQFLSETEISHGWAGTAGPSFDEERFHPDRRPDRGIHHDSSEQKVQLLDTVSMLRSQWRPHYIQIQGPMLWTHPGAHRFHEILETDFGLCKARGTDKMLDSVGRYNMPTSEQPDSNETISIFDGFGNLSGLRGQSTQVQTVTIATARMGSGAHRFSSHVSVSATQEATQRQSLRTIIADSVSQEPEHHTASIRTSSGRTAVLHDDGSRDSTPNAIPRTQIGELPSWTKSITNHMGRYDSTSDCTRAGGVALVGARSEEPQRPADAQTAARPDHSVRRVRHRGWSDRGAGLTNVRGSSFRREVAFQGQRATLAYYNERDFSTSTRHSGTRRATGGSGLAQTTKFGVAESHRQSGGRQLHEQAGRQEVALNANGKRPLELVPIVSDPPSVRVHAWRRHGGAGGRPAKQGALHSHGMADKTSMVQDDRPDLGTSHCGRVRIESERCPTTLLQQMERPTGSGARCATAEPSGGQLVVQSTSRHDPLPPQSHETVRRGVYPNNTSISIVVHSSAQGDVDCEASVDRGPQLNAVSRARRTRKTAADVLELYGLEALQQACTQHGLNESATDAILSQWRLDRSLPGHCNNWNNYWVPYCTRNNISPTAYTLAGPGLISTSVHLTNCISEAQQASADAANAKGKAPQHSILKKIRAAVNAFMLILHPDKPELTYTSYVRAAAKNARLVAPMSKRYSFCFDISQFFDLFCMWYDKGFRNDSMPLNMLRAKALTLARIQTSCRSDDCAKVFRDVMTTRGKKYAGLLMTNNSIQQWRYHRPKNVGSLTGHMSALTSLGAAQFNEGSTVKSSAQMNA